MKKYRLSLLIVFLLSITVSMGQKYAINLIPSELKNHATAVLRDEQMMIDMTKETNIIQKNSKAISILNQSGAHYAELMLFYDKSKSIKDIKGEIYDEFGKQIHKFTVKDFRDYSAIGEVNMFDDIRVKHFRPTVNSYPYTIVYTYEIKHNQNLFIPYWRPNAQTDLAIERSSYQFATSSELKLRIKEHNLPNKGKIDDDSKNKTYTWQINNIQARKEEPFSPLEYEDAIEVKIVPESFHYFKKKGIVNDWLDLGKWINEDLLKGKQDLPQSTIEKVKLLTAEAKSPREKAKILYEYMQEKTRYISIQVGIGGLEPFPASYVDRLGYGDCKALVNYMQSLLNVIGIESYYCIVEAGNRKINLDKSFANAVDGNHIILCLPLENDTTWLECTSNKHPFGYLGNFTDDRLVLACTPEGGKILRTYSYPSESNQQIRKASLYVNKEGSVSGKVQTIFSGTQFDNHFSNVFKNSSVQNKELKSYYDINNITFTAINYLINSNLNPELKEELKIDIRNYVTHNNNQLIFQPNLFNTARAIPDSKNRTNNVYINRGYTDIDEIEYTFEQKLVGQITELEKVLECPMGKYELRIYNEGDIIKIKRMIQLKQGTYPVDDYKKFHTFMKEVAALDRVKYNLNLATE